MIKVLAKIVIYQILVGMIASALMHVNLTNI